MGSSTRRTHTAELTEACLEKLRCLGLNVRQTSGPCSRPPPVTTDPWRELLSSVKQGNKIGRCRSRRTVFQNW
ncbi:hypothetical protein SCLCIDRAFT_1219934 [Scleroderma citrinum Foug A]|uniref:Uncharacterized protein n=1 Tax=Scleroderma citrinum Foug A TaxID=1036808 RepID=A0A0C3DLF9_9AGAM|nr:hypothetical protein SCLCIDRAFT_1219934 [Scleroderma citrinum Foug A]